MTSWVPYERLELVELAAVDDAPQDLAHVERHAHVGRRDAEQLLGVEQRAASAVADGRGPELAPVEAANDLAADPEGVELVVGEVVAQAGDPGVHVGAAQRLLVGVLVDRHLHERRAAEEHLRLALRRTPCSRSCPGT